MDTPLRHSINDMWLEIRLDPSLQDPYFCPQTRGVYAQRHDKQHYALSVSGGKSLWKINCAEASEAPDNDADALILSVVC